jgi:hypothetical protein
MAALKSSSSTELGPISVFSFLHGGARYTGHPTYSDDQQKKKGECRAKAGGEQHFEKLRHDNPVVFCVSCKTVQRQGIWMNLCTILDKCLFSRDGQINGTDINIVKISGILVQHNTKRHYF